MSDDYQCASRAKGACELASGPASLDQKGSCGARTHDRSDSQPNLWLPRAPNRVRYVIELRHLIDARGQQQALAIDAFEMQRPRDLYGPGLLNHLWRTWCYGNESCQQFSSGKVKRKCITLTKDTVRIPRELTSAVLPIIAQPPRRPCVLHSPCAATGMQSGRPGPSFTDRTRDQRDPECLFAPYGIAPTPKP
jgi:hypothetical protein